MMDGEVDSEITEEEAAKIIPVSAHGIQYIRAIIREDGVTELWNYHGYSTSCLPIHKLKREIVHPLLHKITDDKRK